jgi:hypothetical protein
VAQLPAERTSDEEHAGSGYGLVDVHSGPSGEDPHSTVTIDSASVGVIGPIDVTCLTVSGNRASMFAAAPPNNFGVAGLVISVEDNGPGQDAINWHVATVAPDGCPVPSEVAGATTSGDIVVTDAQPFPTSKDQCKGSGWRDFPQFKNQGQCIQFVRHHT